MINETEFLNTLTEIFRSELDDDTLHLNMSTAQANLITWDSLAHVRLVMRVESAFGIQFEADEIEGMSSVRDFFDATTRHLG